MDFNDHILWKLDVFGVEVWITQTTVSTWVIMLLLTVVAVIVRIALRKWKTVPGGFQNLIEMAVEFFDKMVKDVAGENFMSMGSWFFMVFAFMMFSALGGIFGLRPPTADWPTTFAFALATFLLIQVMGIRRRKGKYLKRFWNPLNWISELTRPLSLSFRLYGNMLAGMIISTLIYSLPVYLRFVLPVPLHAYIDLFAGILQTYIFCVLSLTFISTAATPD